MEFRIIAKAANYTSVICIFYHCNMLERLIATLPAFKTRQDMFYTGIHEIMNCEIELCSTVIIDQIP